MQINQQPHVYTRLFAPIEGLGKRGEVVKVLAKDLPALKSNGISSSALKADDPANPDFIAAQKRKKEDEEKAEALKRRSEVELEKVPAEGLVTKEATDKVNSVESVKPTTQRGRVR